MIVFGLKRFRQYLLGRRTLVRSDHGALSYLRRTREPVEQQARWLDYIEQFDITVQHRSGSAHRAADALSRRPCEVSGPCKQCTRGGATPLSRQSVNVSDREGAAGSVHRCAGVVTRGQRRRQAANESEQGLFSPPGSSPTVQDSVTENPLWPRGGVVADPPSNSGRAAGPPLVMLPALSRRYLKVSAGQRKNYKNFRQMIGTLARWCPGWSKVSAHPERRLGPRVQN